MKKKKHAALVAVLLACAPLTPLAVAQAPQSLPTAPAPSYGPVWLSVGAQGHAVTQVQYVLRSFGYGVGVDGLYGPQTSKAVEHWQMVNGLRADGIVGPATWHSMGLDRPELPAEGPVGHATANIHTRLCSQYHGLLAAEGLPVTYFARIMYRESKCDPTAYNGKHRDRSYGLLQINTKGALWGELQRRCGLTSKDQLFDPATNVACAARLYRVYGTRPWRTR